ncbi:aldo/keto reductase, putative [Trypanosoma equiperdum]|uniref:Aldo/keto reductase, putative n=1 Tax=Trypanosoma equiperdum TaxID=5694 RepID=A0A1G4I3K1_TRYEQ|nr:aldo/keto reductase, putative [Trypanosoma equiperdum]
MDRIPYLVSSGGMQIPHMGIGTYELRGKECEEAVLSALKLGFRLIDTAAGYRNEEYVGAAIRASGVPRFELFIVVKIAPKVTRTEEAVETCIRESVRKLCIDYADCVLIHWPGCGGRMPHETEEHKAARRRCWKVMTALQQEGIVRHLGVSNFAGRHFAALSEDGSEATLFAEGKVNKPVVNQIELHPLCVQKDVGDYCKEHGIILQQYSPLGQCNAKLIEHPALCSVVKDTFSGFSVHDVLLLWGLSQGFCVIVRSKSKKHIERNWEVAKSFFSEGALTKVHLERLRDLRELMKVEGTEDHHFCWHSNTID